MAKADNHLKLHVEGIDDKWSLLNLLTRHEVGYIPGQKEKDIPAWLPLFKPADSVETLLALIETEVQASTGRPVGFVLDADAPIMSRWQAVRDRLSRVGVSALNDVPPEVPPPEVPPPEGFIGKSTQFKVPAVGVWLMPDNVRDGKLEDFLADLIAADDPLIDHAREATAAARELGATFSDPDVIKAEVHSWLAWQDEPGKPYGQAMMARYFQHDADVAARFVAWFKQLYGLDSSVQP